LDQSVNGRSSSIGMNLGVRENVHGNIDREPAAVRGGADLRAVWIDVSSRELDEFIDVIARAGIERVVRTKRIIKVCTSPQADEHDPMNSWPT